MISKTLGRSRQYANRAVGGLALIVAHELNALSGHWAEARERVAVARQARGLGELVRNQIDLVPETRARLALDQRERRQLINGLWTDLRKKKGPGSLFPASAERNSEKANLAPFS